MGFLDDLFKVLGNGLEKSCNRMQEAQDSVRGLPPKEIARKMQSCSSSLTNAGYGTELKEKYKSMSYSQQDEFLDYLISKNYTKAYNMVKDL